MVFFPLCFFSFFHFEKRRKHLKQKSINRRAGAKAKNEKVEWELKGKFPPFSTFFFFVFLFFYFAWEENNAKTKHLKQKCKSERA
jgi:hypothetical protein